MKYLKITIFLLVLVPNLAFAETKQPFRRIIEEESSGSAKIETVDQRSNRTVTYGLASVLLAIIAIFAFTTLMNMPAKPVRKKHDSKL